MLGAAPKIRGTGNAGFRSGSPEFLLGHSLEFTRERCHNILARHHYYDCYIVSGHNNGTLYEKQYGSFLPCIHT